ncbi:MAG: pyridoxamine 5'-phosphate oxidase family protein [Williamsia sp.]|nr:pyridoxamine 5'-phosphate oxidase family protein [Williamsia sp.]
MFHSLTSIEIEDMLKHQLIGHLGCQADGMVYVVPISYAYEDGFIYARTQEGMKINMMRKNPAVCFQVEVTSDLANWKSVIAWGEYEELTDPEERKKGLNVLLKRILPVVTSETMKITADWPYAPDDLNEITGIIFRIEIRDKTGRVENKEPKSFFAS